MFWGIGDILPHNLKSLFEGYGLDLRLELKNWLVLMLRVTH